MLPKFINQLYYNFFMVERMLTLRFVKFKSDLKPTREEDLLPLFRELEKNSEMKNKPKRKNGRK